MADSKTLDVWDLTAILGYFAAVLIVSIASMFRSNRGTKEGYFLAGRFMTWLPVGASLFASNIGSEHFIGLAGSGAASGLGVGAFELNACLLLQLLGWVFLPVFIASRVCTLPEYMSKRFGGTRIQIYLASLSLILYIFTKISVNLYSGALFIQVAVGWNIWTSIAPLLIVAAFITVTGGLAAVIYTDTLQCFLMVIGGIVVMAKAFYEVGGWSGLYDKWFDSYSAASIAAVSGTANETLLCNQPSEKGFIMLRALDDPDMPWLGFLLGQTPASIWYWCADQMMVQRALASKNLSHAQGATLFAGVIKFSPLFLLVIPGMISRVLFPNEVACATRDECMAACGSPVSCTNIAYPKLVMELMPSGLRGAMLAVMLAALMSDLTSIFNSASSLFTIDIYGKIKMAVCKRKSQESVYVDTHNGTQASGGSNRRLQMKEKSVMSNIEMMVVGRVFVLVMVAVSVAWVPMIQNMQGGQLYVYIQSIAADLSPPVAAVYLVAIFWRRANEQGAFYGLMGGFVVGLSRMVLDMIYRSPSCGEEDTRPEWIVKFQYMYFAMFLFIFTILVIVVVSILTEPTPENKIIRTTYWTRLDTGPRFDEDPVGNLNKIELSRRESVSVDPAEMADEEMGQKVTNNSSQFMDNGAQVVHQNGFKKPSNEDREVNKAKKLCMFILGIDYKEASSTTTASDRLKNQKTAEQIKAINTAEQKPRDKIILNVLLVVIVGVAVALYLFFSVGTRYLYPPPSSSGTTQ